MCYDWTQAKRGPCPWSQVSENPTVALLHLFPFSPHEKTVGICGASWARPSGASSPYDTHLCVAGMPGFLEEMVQTHFYGQSSLFLIHPPEDGGCIYVSICGYTNSIIGEVVNRV